LKCLVSIADDKLAEKVASCVSAFFPVESCAPEEIARQRGVALVFADEGTLDGLRPSRRGPPVVGVCQGPIADNVEYLGRLPWLSQIVTPKVLTTKGVRRLLYGILRQRPGIEVDSLAFLGGSNMHAQRVLFYRSSDMLKQLDRLEKFAGKVGARNRTIEQLHDIGNELLSNAFYDAPYEAGLFSAPPARQQEVRLPPDSPCELVYGSVDDELFVRVRDCFGALTRARLMEVLLRCARGSTAVALDESRGGAGLGMWRIFRLSSRVVISVVPGVSSELLVTVSKSGTPAANLRAWHLLFGGAPAVAEKAVSR
jgi:hypothetical protein